MNAIFKDAFEQIEKLSPDDQKTLAEEMEKRAYELWLEAKLEKGEASGGEKPMNAVFERLTAKYAG